MCSDAAAILSLTRHPDYAAAVPTEDHFIPLLYIAGLAGVDAPAKALVQGCALGSISMTCYGVGCGALPAPEGASAAGLPAGVPADQTNT